MTGLATRPSGDAGRPAAGGAGVHVVAAVLMDARGRVLIQRRPESSHQGGLWEFPGGKLQPGEDRRAGLVREIREELGLRLRRFYPLVAVRHDYGDRQVLLDVWRVLEWEGTPEPLEAQPLAWAAPATLARFDFPAADRPVLRALGLPATCLITPAPGADAGAWLDGVARAAASGIELIQLRAPRLDERRLCALAAQAVARCRSVSRSVRLLVNGDPALARDAGADGVQLSSRRLWSVTRRPLDDAALVGASCHDAADLRRAACLGLDFALLAPVAATPTHPGAVPLGWRTFSALVQHAALPVYALGGMSPATLEAARGAGAHGIAGITGLWPGSSEPFVESSGEGT